MEYVGLKMNLISAAVETHKLVEKAVWLSKDSGDKVGAPHIKDMKL